MSDDQDMTGGLFTGNAGYNRRGEPAASPRGGLSAGGFGAERGRAGRPGGKNDTPAAKRQQAERQARLLELIERRFGGLQVVLAEAVGVDNSTLSKLLGGKRTITDAFCRRVAEVADVSADWLLSGLGDINTPAPPQPDLAGRTVTDHHEGNNLRAFREGQHLSKKALGERMGHPASTASSSVLQYEQSQQLSPSTKAALARAFGLDEAAMGAVLSGRGAGLRPTLEDDYVEVPFIPVRARASFARSLYDDTNYENDMIKVHRDSLRPGFETTPARRGRMYVAEVNGDSMEPTLHSGYRVSVYLVDAGDWQYATGLVAVCYRDEFVIKRIKDNRLLLDGHLTLHSDNELGGSRTVPMGEIRAMFRVDEIVGGKVK